MTTAQAITPELIDGVTTWLRSFADRADETGAATHVDLDINMVYRPEGPAEIVAAVRRLADEGYHGVLYTEKYASRLRVTFHPRTHHPERAGYSFRYGRTVLAAYWQ